MFASIWYNPHPYSILTKSLFLQNDRFINKFTDEETTAYYYFAKFCRRLC